MTPRKSGERTACLCGCGKLVINPGARFLRGHYRRLHRDASRPGPAAQELEARERAMRDPTTVRCMCGWAHPEKVPYRDAGKVHRRHLASGACTLNDKP